MDLQPKPITPEQRAELDARRVAFDSQTAEIRSMNGLGLTLHERRMAASDPVPENLVVRMARAAQLEDVTGAVLSGEIGLDDARARTAELDITHPK